MDKTFSKILANAFLAMIDTVDVVVTDRLHVGICGYLLGKEVVLIDNSYGKLSSVYQYSCQEFENVALIKAEDLESTLESISVRAKVTRREELIIPDSYIGFAKEYLLDKMDSDVERIMWRM